MIRELGIALSIIIIGIPLAAVGAVEFDRFRECSAASASGIATSWTPWGGCRVTVLGTEIQVGK